MEKKCTRWNCGLFRKKKDLISLSLWKNGCGLLFWNHISLKNTLKTKQNWQSRIYCLVLFCLWPPVFVPLPWQHQGYLSLQAFYNNVPFLTKQQRKYQVKPLPPSNDQVNSGSVFQRAQAQSHVRPHAVMLLMRNIQFVIGFPSSRLSLFFLNMFCSLTLKEKGGDGFLFIPQAQKVSSARNTRWRQRKLTPRLDFGPFWDYSSVCLKHSTKHVHIQFPPSLLDFFWANSVCFTYTFNTSLMSDTPPLRSS